MGKKKKHPEHENLERWLVSYADFITLLFATFTALYALSIADVNKFKEMAKGIREGFAQQSLLKGAPSIMQGQSSSDSSQNITAKQAGDGDGVLGQYKNMVYTEGNVEADQAEDVAKSVKTAVKKMNEEIKQANQQAQQDAKAEKEAPKPDKGKAPQAEKDAKEALNGVGFSVQERGMKVSFDSRLLFKPGTAILTPEGEKALDRIAIRIKTFARTHQIHVEGHTDAQPITSPLFPSNWELSTARASYVVRYLIKNHGFSPEHLVAVGYGDSRPIATNDTPAGRRQNRRIDIVIFSREVGEKTDPLHQRQKEKTLVEPKATAEGVEGKIIKIIPIIHSDKVKGNPLVFSSEDKAKAGVPDKPIEVDLSKPTPKPVPTQPSGSH